MNKTEKKNMHNNKFMHSAFELFLVGFFGEGFLHLKNYICENLNRWTYFITYIIYVFSLTVLQLSVQKNSEGEEVGKHWATISIQKGRCEELEGGGGESYTS